jgi:hypothetical protein
VNRILPRSRLVLIGLVAGLVLGTAGVSAADDGQPLIMGTSNTSSTGTSYTSTDANAPALRLTGSGSQGGEATLLATNNSGEPAIEGISSNIGVDGESANGVSVAALTPCCNNTGTALQVDGTARFLRSGTVTIAYPNKTATVLVGTNGYGRLTSRSLVLATLQKFVSGVWVAATVPILSGSSDTFVLHLNRAPGSASHPKSVTVAWFVAEHP